MSKISSNINPHFKRNPKKSYSLQECINGISDFKILAHLISKSESNLLEDKNFVSEVISQTVSKKISRRIAISGSPGVGKSTFINSLGKALLSQEKTIAILPVDPSSHVSRGSILGDKTRMEDLIKSDQVFIKPMASSLSLGGVAPATQMASILCERAGFDYVFIETVGVGQSEYEVKHLVDLFILLLQPGGGDDLQGIKRGIMEMADLMVITKADGLLLNNARASFDSYSHASQLMLQNDLGWKAKVKMYSSLTNEGQETILKCINQYFKFLSEADKLDVLRKRQRAYFFDKSFKSLAVEHFRQNAELQLKLEALKTKLLDNSILLFEAKNEMKQLVSDA